MWKSHVDPVHLLSPSPSPCARLFCCGTRVSTPPEDREQTDRQAGEDRAGHGKDRARQTRQDKTRPLSVGSLAALAYSTLAANRQVLPPSVREHLPSPADRPPTNTTPTTTTTPTRQTRLHQAETGGKPGMAWQITDRRYCPVHLLFHHLALLPCSRVLRRRDTARVYVFAWTDGGVVLYRMDEAR